MKLDSEFQRSLLLELVERQRGPLNELASAIEAATVEVENDTPSAQAEAHVAGLVEVASSLSE